MSSVVAYAELQALSNFSFLRGASHPEELVAEAKRLGLRAIAITDYGSLAGIVRAHSAAKKLDLPYVVGARVEVFTPKRTDEGVRMLRLLAYPTDRASYGTLCRLLTLGRRRACEGNGGLLLEELLQAQDLILTAVPPPFDTHHANTNEIHFLEACRVLRDTVTRSELLSIALTRNYTYENRRYAQGVLQVAESLEIPIVASADVYYHNPCRRPLQDVLTCIREKCTVPKAGFLLLQNGEHYLKPVPEMARLFRDMPQALRRSVELSEIATQFSLDQLRYEYPNEICPVGKTPLHYLTELTGEGAKERYPNGIPERIQRVITEELGLIHELNYEKYFLTCHDIVRFARSRGILCQGRGAAANSAVCFCLGITAVDPSHIDLLFARFVSKERSEPPDIDIDFEHERREEVIQYIYEKYGRERAGITAEVITYRNRSALRDVGKALGLSLHAADVLAKSLHRWTGCTIPEGELRELGFDPSDVVMRNTFLLAGELLGFPRHLSQHVGGFIISEKPLCETVPILNASMPERTFIEWDKDDIELLGMLKIDVLGLGMLSVIRKALEFVNTRRATEKVEPLALYSIPHGDAAVYDMICAADTIGVFQIESRAQMSMLPRLKPRRFYDLVVEIAIVRPGPIQGNMVHPYLKRRSGQEAAIYPDERVRGILGKTLGVPIFQEQAMRLAIVLADFTPGEAEMFRRALSSWKRDKGAIAKFRARIVQGMMSNGYTRQFAENYMEQIKGFSEYGFPESHAASFALVAYASAWLKKHYPAEFAAGLINSQPMGFYAPAQIIADAARHGVTVLPIDSNKSEWNCTLERDGAEYALRLGLRLVKHLRREEVEIMTERRKHCGESGSISSLWATVIGSIRKETLRHIANADGFRSMGLTSREALWEIRALVEQPLPFDCFMRREKRAVSLPSMTRQQEIFQDYSATGLSLKGHPLACVRDMLTERKVSTAQELRTATKIIPNTIVSIAGIAIFKQRPPTAKGIVFITLEDETGITNLIIKPEIFERYHKIILNTSTLLAKGKIEGVGEVIYINTFELESLDREILPRCDMALAGRSYSY